MYVREHYLENNLDKRELHTRLENVFTVCMSVCMYVYVCLYVCISVCLSVTDVGGSVGLSRSLVAATVVLSCCCRRWRDSIITAMAAACCAGVGAALIAVTSCGLV